MNMINQMDFNIELDDGQPLFSCRSELTEWLQRNMLPVIERVLDDLGVDLVIDQLDIDLGDFSRDDFARRIPTRLEDKLKESMQSQVNKRSEQQDADSSEILMTVLTKALSGLAIDTLDSQWLNVIKNNERQVRDFIFEQARQLKTRQVIAWQFPDSLQNQVISLLEPLNGHFIQQLLSHASLFNGSRQKASEQQEHLSENNIKHTRPHLVEYTIGYLVLDRGSQFNKKSYLQSLIRQQAARHNSHYLELVEEIRCAISEVEMSDDLRSRLLEHLPDSKAIQKNNSGTNGEGENQQVEQSGQVKTDYSIEQLLNDARKKTRQATYIQNWIEDMLSFKQEKLLRQIKELSDSPALFSRFIALIPDKYLEKVVELWAPAIHRDIQVYSDIMKGGTLSSELSQTADSVRQIIWRSSISYIKSERSSTVFKPQVYFQYYMESLTEYCSLPVHDIIQILKSQLSLNLSGSHKSYHHKLNQVIDKFYGENLSATSDQKAQHLHSNPDKAEESTTALAVFIKSGHWTLPDSEWQQILNLNPDALKRYLKELSLSGQQIRQLLKAMPRNVISDWIDLLVGQNDEFFKTLWHHSGFKQWLRAPAQKQKSGGFNSADWDNAVTEFTLEYLLIEKASSINRKVYLQQLIRRLASRYNLRYEQFFLALQQSFRSMSLPAAVIMQLDAVFEHASLTEATGKNKNSPARSYVKPLDGFVQLEQLDRLLIENRTGTAQQLQITLDTLVKHFPIQIFRWFQQLPATTGTDQKHLNTLTADRIQRLIKCFWRLTPQVNRSESETIFTQLSSYAEKTQSPSRFYLFYLVNLIRGKAVSFQTLEKQFIKAPVVEQKNSLIEAADAKQNTNACISDDDPVLVRVRALLSHPGLTINYLTTRLPAFIRQEVIPDSLLASLIKRINPECFNKAVSVAEVLRLLSITDRFRLPAATLKEVHWISLLHYLSNARDSLNVTSLTNIYIRVLQHHLKNPKISSADIRQLWYDALLQQQSVIPAKLFEDIKAELNKGIKPDACNTKKNKREKNDSLSKELPMAIKNSPGRIISDDEYFSKGERIPVNNAGVVLTSSYIPMLFERLEILNPDKTIEPSSNERALAILDYLGWGDSEQIVTGNPLNLLLCGMPLDYVSEQAHSLDESSRQLINSLLQGIIQHWSALGNTSAQGIRETFLQRPGTLEYLGDKGWQLHIEDSAYDVLLDRLPWSYATIKLPFMLKPIYVHWRNTRHEHGSSGGFTFHPGS